MSLGDYVEDGGFIAAPILGDCVQLYASGAINAAYITTLCQLTTPQAAEMATLLATQPSTGLLGSLTNAKAVSQWPQKVKTILCMAQGSYADFVTEAELKTALGV